MLQVFLVSRSPGLHTNKPCYTLNKQTYTMLRNNKDFMSLGTAKGHLVNVTVLKRDNPKMQSPKLGDYSNFPTFHQWQWHATHHVPFPTFSTQAGLLLTPLFFFQSFFFFLIFYVLWSRISWLGINKNIFCLHIINCFCLYLWLLSASAITDEFCLFIGICILLWASWNENYSIAVIISLIGLNHWAHHYK